MQCGLLNRMPSPAGVAAVQQQHVRSTMRASPRAMHGNRPAACATRQLRVTALHSSARATPIGARQQQRPAAAGALLSPAAAAVQQQQQRGVGLRCRAMDAMPAWTLDQIAGLAFGGLMVAFYFGASQVDVFIAKQQRRQLGLCEQCGGLYEPGTCAQAGCPLKAGGGSGAAGGGGANGGS